MLWILARPINLCFLFLGRCPAAKGEHYWLGYDIFVGAENAFVVDFFFHDIFLLPLS